MFKKFVPILVVCSMILAGLGLLTQTVSADASQPVADLNLTFMAPCKPVEGNPASAEWRVRNPNTFAVDFTVNLAGGGQMTGTAQPGDSFFTTPWGSQTLILGWSDNGTPKSKTKAGGDSFNGTTCEVPTPIADLNLTFMQPCKPAVGNPANAEWRITNPNSFSVDYTVEKVGTGQILTGTAPTGISFFTTSWGSQTLILKWVNETGVNKSKNKAGGDSYNGTTCVEPTVVVTTEVPTVVVTTEVPTVVVTTEVPVITETPAPPVHREYLYYDICYKGQTFLQVWAPNLENYPGYAKGLCKIAPVTGGETPSFLTELWQAFLSLFQ